MHFRGEGLSVSVEETARFVQAHLIGRRRILDVGAGDGRITARLRQLGFEVTAIDPSKKAVEKAHQRGIEVTCGDIREFSCSEPFDAVLFSMSLHHIHPLSLALDRAKACLVPGGTLLLEDFDVEAADEASSRWYYGAKALLISTGVIAYAMESPVEIARDPLRLWRADHQDHGTPLNSGTSMTTEIKSRFEIVVTESAPYFYRYLAENLPATAGIPVFELEKALIEAGQLKALGRRVVARSKDRL